MTKHIIAAFDFDGTITYRDTPFSFFLFVKGFPKTLFYLFLKLTLLIGYFLGAFETVDQRRICLNLFFGGLPASEFNCFRKAFAKGRLTST